MEKFKCLTCGKFVAGHEVTTIWYYGGGGSNPLRKTEYYCPQCSLAMDREENIRKDGFDKQKPFSTSPIRGRIRNNK